MKEIALELETLVGSDSDLVKWENAEPQWQERIDRAFATPRVT